MNTRPASNEVKLQRDYYARTATCYDEAHLHTGESHDLAIQLLIAMMDYHGFDSVLDVGAGTGRALRVLRERFPSRHIVGIEPVTEMRLIGHQHGLPVECLLEGDGMQIPFPSDSFDVVSAFGVLHHVPNPSGVIAEMLRVARRGIFISDANRFAQGGALTRHFKRWCWNAGLWPIVDFLRTRGRGYTYSEGDGVAYSYSIFDNFAQIKAQCPIINLLSLTGHDPDLVTGAAQIGFLALKPPTSAAAALAIR